MLLGQGQIESMIYITLQTREPKIDGHVDAGTSMQTHPIIPSNEVA